MSALLSLIYGIPHDGNRKDDYAFFIRPVDPAQVPGYADAIKSPMDFGTMSVKVSRGKYRSLEEFTVRRDWSGSQYRLIPRTTDRLSARDDECQSVQSSWIDLLHRG